jgi:iron complex outermembrane receptor protein
MHSPSASRLILVLAATFIAAPARVWAAESESDERQQLAAVEVSDTRPRLTDATALKLPVSLHETPRSLSILDGLRFREQDFRSLNDTYRYVPGVFARSQVSDAYHFMSRGFDMGPDDTRVDGFSGTVVNGSFSPSLFGIEQVVYLRGPAGLLYGAAPTPGGTINLITKKPREMPLTRIDARVSTYAGGGVDSWKHGSAEIEFDSTGPLKRDGRVLYRVVSSASSNGFFTDGVHDRARNFLAAVTWKFGRDDRFVLTPLFEYQYAPFAAQRAVVISPSTSLGTADGQSGPVVTSDLSPLTRNLGGGGRSLTSRIVGVDGSAQLGPHWKVAGSYRYFSVDQDIAAFAPQAATLVQRDREDPRSWFISRKLSKSATDRRSHNFDLQATFEAAPSESIRTLTQLGFNGRFFQTSASRAAATQPNQSPINIYTGETLSPLVDPNPVLVDDYLTDDFYWNAYLQNQLAWRERWVITASVGYGEQRFDRHYPAGVAIPANLAQITATRRGAITPNLSLLYHVTPSLALYASSSTSYSPAPGDSENSAGETGTFSPTTGTNYEAGFKFDPPTLPGKFTLSVFETALDNVLMQSDPTQLNARGNRYYVQTGGGRRTRGVEFSSELHPARGWRVNLTGSALDSRYRGEGRLPGSRAERTPLWAFSVFQRYDFSHRSVLRGFGASVGVTWEDKRWSTARTSAAPDPLLLPAHTRIDAALYYRVAQWDLSLHCENLLDRTYWVGGTTGAALEPGAPRSLALRVGYRY